MKKLILASIFLISLFTNKLIAQQAGDLDSIFGGDGIVTTSFTSNSEYAYAVAIQPDGKIIAAGSSANSAGTSVYYGLTRYNPDGSLDTSFDSDGLVTTSFINRDIANALAVQPDGKIIAAGFSQNTGSVYFDFSLARYNSNGSLDTSFSGDGKVITTLSGNSDDEINSVALQLDGKIVVGGYADSGITMNNFALARYNSNGDLDTTFGLNGKVISDFGLIYSSEVIGSMTIQPDGKIIGAGLGDYGFNTKMLIVRYNSNGSFDSTFNFDGKLYISFGSNSNNGATAIALQSDGKIVVAGGTNPSGTSWDYALTRINTDGTLDSTFGINGQLTTAIGTYNDVANAVAIQSDGKIVAAGSSLNVFSMARYNTDGSLDSSFSTDGKLMTSVGGFSWDEANSIAIQPDGKIVLAGSAKTSQLFYDFGIVRYLSSSNVGINDLAEPDNSVLIYPNPITDKLTITTKTNEQLEISLYDVTSRKILKQSFVNSTSINTEQLAKGIYLYEVRNKSGVIKQGKVVKD